MRNTRGFTLVEIIVVVSVISILAGIVIFNAVQGSMRSRDIDRQADLRTLQSAIELYKQRYGRYPAQCARANPGLAGVWSGEPNTNFACVTGEQYIMGHIDTTDYDRDGDITERFTFAPEFIPTLPIDKRRPDVNSGYVYTVNTAGTVYKLVARRTVETETITNSHPLKSCDVSGANTGLCDTTSTNNPWGGGTPGQCQSTNTTFRTSYGVWGGYARTGNIEELTEAVICQ